LRVGRKACATKSEIGIQVEVTWFWVSLSISLAVGFVSAWYLWARRSSQNRAIQVLHWIENSLGGYGHVTGIRWVDAETFEVPIRISKNIFRKSRFHVQMAPRELPLNWLWRRVRSGKDTLVFSADLDYGPRFAMQLRTQRWFARTRKDATSDETGWNFESCQPVVLTTRLDWQKEVAGMMRSVMNCAHRENLNIEFRKTSPHLRMTMPLETIHPESGCKVFEVLRTVADGVSEKAS
jgi:hypothetical protein